MIVRNTRHRRARVGSGVAEQFNALLPVLPVQRAVGSSANMNVGFFTSARPMATRCFSLPESYAGFLLLFFSSPSWSSISSARLPFPSLVPASSPHFKTISNCCRAVSAGKRLYPWTLKPVCLRR